MNMSERDHLPRVFISFAPSIRGRLLRVDGDMLRILVDGDPDPRGYLQDREDIGFERAPTASYAPPEWFGTLACCARP
jgi:hypothetical protein